MAEGGWRARSVPNRLKDDKVHGEAHAGPRSGSPASSPPWPTSPARRCCSHHRHHRAPRAHLPRASSSARALAKSPRSARRRAEADRTMPSARSVTMHIECDALRKRDRLPDRHRSIQGRDGERHQISGLGPTVAGEPSAADRPLDGASAAPGVSTLSRGPTPAVRQAGTRPAWAAATSSGAIARSSFAHDLLCAVRGIQGIAQEERHELGVDDEQVVPEQSRCCERFVVLLPSTVRLAQTPARGRRESKRNLDRWPRRGNDKRRGTLEEVRRRRAVAARGPEKRPALASRDDAASDSPRPCAHRAGRAVPGAAPPARGDSLGSPEARHSNAAPPPTRASA